MPIQPIHVLSQDVSLKELNEVVAKLQKVLNYLLAGNLDFDNIRARGIKAENIEAGTITANEIAADTITADKMNVDELSAITANLGTIIAGIIRGIEIYGSYIATAEGTYPRAEMSNTDNTFVVHLSSTQKLTIKPSGPYGSPAVSFSDLGGSLTASIQTYTLSEDSLLIICDGDIRFNSGTSRIRFPSWSSIQSIASSQTLQNALDAKANKFSGYTGSVAAGTSTLNYTNGILTSVT